MKSQSLCVLLVGLVPVIRSQAAQPDLTSTNLPGITTASPKLAPPIATTASAPASPATNGLSGGNVEYRPSILVREITPTASGAEATFGRHKAYFASDAAGDKPVTVVTPDA